MGRAVSTVGVDIGSYGVKLACVERRRGSWRLVGAVTAPTPPEAAHGGTIKDPEAVAKAIRELLRQSRFPTSEAVGALSGAPVTVRSIKMPVMPEATLRRSVRFEAAKFLPSIDDSAVEYAILGKHGDPPQLDVLLVAAPNDMVNARVTAMQGAGLEPVAVDIEAFALQRVLAAAGLLPKERCAVAAVNIGATLTDLNIVIGNQVAVTRSIPLGGGALTSAVASLLNVTPEEAESLKRKIRLVTDAEAESAGEPEGIDAETDERLRQAALPFLSEIIRELRRSMNFFQSQASEAGHAISIDHVYLTGGTARLPGLSPYLAERMGTEVSILDPFAGCDAAALNGQSAVREQGCELAVALGLALKEYD